MAVGAVIVAAVVAVVVVRSNTPTPSADPIAGLQGILVYTDADVQSGRARLWAWNLETGEISEGPEVDTPVQLVDAFEAGPGWVALASGDRDGMRASSLDTFATDRQETTVLDGDLVTWGPFGEEAAAVTIDEDDVCELRAVAVSADVESRTEPFPCGHVDAIARSSAKTFLGFSSAGHSEIVSTLEDGGVVHEIDDARLVSVSETGRILAVDTRCRAEDMREGQCQGLGLVNVIPDPFLGGEPTRELVRYGERDATLLFESLAGWSRFGDRAYVVGSYRGVLGLYGIPVPRPSEIVDEPIMPERLLPALTLDMSVTETSTGELLIARAGTLVLSRAGAPPEYFQPPSGVPPIAGPIVWLPSLAGVTA
ncbi:MAG TPA: hypothetical protein VIB62_07885 [Actinomycetota bacterium]